MKKISIILLMLFLCGCEIKELENRDFVLEVLIDKEQEYICNVGVAEFSSQDGNSSLTMKFLQGKGGTIAKGLEEINTDCSGQLYYGHTQFCVISLEALKDENTLKELVDLSERNEELNRRIIVLATDSIDEFKSDEKGDDYNFIKDYYSGNDKHKERNMLLDLGRLTKQLLETENGLMPVIHKDKEGIKVDRCGVIKNNALVGITTQDEAKGIMWLYDYERVEDVVDININDMPATIKLREKKIEKKPFEDKLVINISAEGEIIEYSLGKSFDEKNIKEITEKKLKEKINSALKLLQQEYKTDAIGIAEHYRKNNYGVYMNNRDNIDDFFNNLPVEVNVEINFSKKSSIG